MSSNLGWMFYKDYFRGLDYFNLDTENNRRIINNKINSLLNSNPELESNEDEALLGNLHIKATTTYPGLLLGSGNIHELPIEGQLILGFSFDYTTGLPVIAGSSIKGVFRNAFKHRDYIQELLDNRFNSDEIEKIEEEIFDNGDIFFDAVPISKGTTLLSDDYLAPHEDELKEPIPLRFLKVSPNVTFRFDFEVKNGLLTKEEKKELFKKILEDLGLGAKTNVGYGKFTNITTFKTEEEKRMEKREKDKEKIDNAKTSAELKEFIRNNPLSELLEKAKEKLAKLEIEEKKEAIKQIWEKLNKNKKEYVKSFIEKYKDIEFAKEYVEKAKQILDKTNKKIENSEFELSKFTKLKPLANYLKKFDSLNNEQIEKLKIHLLNNINYKKVKRKEFPFGVLKKFMSDKEANDIADKLNLK